MADFYPSEVARLVLGYLKEVNCPKTWRTFIEECVDLQEHYQLLRKGRSCSTKIGRKSLLEILHEYCYLIDSRDCDSLSIQEPTAEFEGLFLLTESTQTNKDESKQVPVIETLSSKKETDSATMHDGTRKTKNEHNSIHETSSKLTTSSEVLPVTSESVINVEVPECMQTHNDQSNLTWESGSIDMSTSCMPIIQPDAETQLRNCNFEQSRINLNNNDVHSAASNIKESSTLVSASERENMARLDNADSWKPVSIGTLLQAGTQIPGSRSICSFNESIPATHQQLCSTFSSPKYRESSFFPSNFNVAILPAVQNQRQLSTDFSPRNENLPSNISDQIKSSEIGRSFSFHGKTVKTLSSKCGTDSAMTHDGSPKTKNEHNSIQETSSKLPTSSEVFPVTSESVINVEVLECMQTDNDQSNLTWESGSIDMSTSCMPIIQSDAETQLRNCNVDQSRINLNNVDSAASNINESSTLVSASEMENMARLDNADTWKPVSIGAQIPGSRSICSFNESIPATHQQLCSPFSSSKYKALSFFPSNFNVTILPGVQNQRQLSTGFSPRGQTSPSNISDQIKSYEVYHSFSFRDKAVEKQQEKISPIHLKSSLNESADSPMIPVGIKTPTRWNNRKNKYHYRKKKIKKMKNAGLKEHTNSKKDVDFKEDRCNTPNIRVGSYISPSETNSFFERENEHSSDILSRQDTYRTLYSERLAQRLQLEYGRF